ncbi:hypothetical protein KA107_03300 [Candidatus Pacearchaeota archaeon]|nr:hypothetical protein [Candidatus Pacearchaeota archaeon]
MPITRELYLLYAFNQGGWGVFNMGTCPDPHDFPKWAYRKYSIPSEKERIVFRKLMDIQAKLVSGKIVPSEEKEEEIFPKLEDLLKEQAQFIHNPPFEMD